MIFGAGFSLLISPLPPTHLPLQVHAPSFRSAVGPPIGCISEIPYFLASGWFWTKGRRRQWKGCLYPGSTLICCPISDRSYVSPWWELLPPGPSSRGPARPALWWYHFLPLSSRPREVRASCCCWSLIGPFLLPTPLNNLCITVPLHTHCVSPVSRQDLGCNNNRWGKNSARLARLLV